MSDAYSFGSSDDDTIGPPTPLKKFRQKYYAELQTKPEVYRKLLALTKAEVGNQGPEAQQAFLETVFNRAATRGQTLDEAMQLVTKGGYYPGLGDYNKVSPQEQTDYGDLINQVRSGSNVGNYATGNASGTVGFNKGPQVAEYGGERYGIEGPDLKTMHGIAGGTIDPLEASTFDPTGRKRMANGDNQQGILGALGMQNQQPQGLLGALGDPETMAYIGMMLKGMNPYSQIDPNAMLSAAHTNALRKQALMQQQAERATDNTRADRALNLREQEYGLQREDRQARDAALFEERQQKRDLAAKQKEIDDEVRRNLGGGMPGEAAPEGGGGARAVPEGTRSVDDQIDQLNRELAKNPSPSIAKSIERRIERLQTQEKDKAIPAELAGRLGMTDVYLKKADKIGAAIDKGDLTGPMDLPLAKYGQGKSAEIYRDMQSGADALTRMMTGAGMPASEAEAYAQRYLPAWNDNATSLRSKHDRLVEELKTIKATVEKGRVKSPGASTSGASATEGAKAPDFTQAKRAPDGKYYIPDPNRPGGYLRVEP